MSRQYGQDSARSQQRLYNRSALLGNASSKASSSDQVNLTMDDDSLEYMESQSDKRTEGLRGKVSILKELSNRIGDEIRHGNDLTNTMNDQFLNTGSILSKTLSSFKVMASKQSGSVMCLLTLFIVGAVFLAYYIFFK